MATFQVKKYKLKTDENGNKIQVTKTKEEWNKETKNGTATWYFVNRYKINGITKQYKSALFALKRTAEDEDALFRLDPIKYIQKHSKRAKLVNSATLNSENQEKTLNKYFEEYIIYKKDYVKPSSIYESKQDWKCHISKDIGSLAPKELNFTVIQNWKIARNNELNPKTNKTFVTGTKNKWYSTLSEFLQFLVHQGLIEINYAKILGQFKNPNINKNARKSIRFQTEDIFMLFIEEVNDDFWFIFFNFLFWHGCRIGEQRALRVKDVDFQKNIIHFHESFSKGEDGKEMLGPIKNGKERYIYLSPKSRDYLISLIDKYKQIDGYSGEWFLFGGYSRLPAKTIENRLNTYYNSLMEKYPNKQIVRLTHHEFGRHSHASYLLNLGLEKGLSESEIISMIATRLGDTPEVIRRTYAHPYESENNSKIEQLLNI